MALSKIREIGAFGGRIKYAVAQADAPGVTDDSTKGWEQGDMWKVRDGALYICDDNAEGAADWDNVTGS